MILRTSGSRLLLVNRLLIVHIVLYKEPKFGNTFEAFFKTDHITEAHNYTKAPRNHDVNSQDNLFEVNQ